MSTAELVGLLALLAVFVFAPMLLMFCCSNLDCGPKMGLGECPDCGAEYRGTPAACYACGHKFRPLVYPAAAPTVIQRVRETEISKARSTTKVHAAPATKTA